MTTTPHAPQVAAGGVHVSNAPGTTEISVRTLERIVAQAIKAVPGTVTVDSKLAGIGGRGYPRSIVQSDPNARMTAVESTIAVVWPSPVTQVAAQTRAAIMSAISQFTGYSTTRVNVTVGHVEPGKRISNSAVASPVKFHASIPAVSPTTVKHPVTRSSSTHVYRVDAAEWTNRAQATSVNTPAPKQLSPVSARTQVQVRSIETPQEVEIRPCGEVNTRLEEVFVPESTPRKLQLQEIHVPDELELKKIQVPDEQPLQDIHVESANAEPSRVFAPEPVQLRHIEVHPVVVRKPGIKQTMSKELGHE